jgi:O-antigen ligase
MDTIIEIGIIIGILFSLWVVLARDFQKGLAYAVFWCVWLTTFLRIQTGGVLPELTIHRMILVTLFIFWVKKPEYRARLRSTPLVRPFALWAAISFLSLLGTSIAFGDSLKAYLDFIAEVGVFFVIVSTTLRKREDAIRILRAAALAIAIVAFFGAVEHYTMFNPVDEFIPNYVRDDGTGHDVLSTYQHRILLGTGMAMGFSVCVALLALNNSSRGFPGKKTLWVAIALCLSTCFFAQSRGPWLSCILSLGVMAWLGSAKMRKSLLIIPILAVLTVVIKPGVLDSLSSKAEDTMDTDSFKGGTFKYRLELWKIAWQQVTKDPHRFFLGYGPGSGRGVDLEWSLSYRDWNMKIESWDNQFAYDLFRSGIIGAFASLNLFIGMWWRLYKLARSCDPANRDTVAALVGAVSALIFMMSNVFIFARQLDYLLWSVVAATFVLSGYYEEDEPAAAYIDTDAEAAPFRAETVAG